MTRALALLFAALTMLSGAGPAQAQGFFDMRDIMGGGPSYRGGGSGGGRPIPPATPGYSAHYPPRPHLTITREPRACPLPPHRPGPRQRTRGRRGRLFRDRTPRL